MNGVCEHKTEGWLYISAVTRRLVAVAKNVTSKEGKEEALES